LDHSLPSAVEVAVQDGRRSVDKRGGRRGPDVKLDTDRLDAYRSALGRKLASVAQTPDQAWVLDLEAIHSGAVREIAPKKPKEKVVDEEADADAGDESDVPVGSIAPDVVARAARV